MHRRAFLTHVVRGLGVLIALSVLGCERSTPAPASAANAPPRIVVLSPAVGVTLIDLGLEPLIVGRHAWDVALDPSLPSCGDVTGFDAETLLSVRPSHLVMEWGQRPLPDPVAGFASRGGWDVLDVSPLLTLADVERMTRDVAARFAPVIAAFDPVAGADVRTRADALDASMREAWGDGAAHDSNLARAGRVLLLGSTDPPGILGPGSFHHQMLVAMGGTPALTEGKPWTEASPEDVLALAPDAILIFAPRPFDRAHPDAASSPQPDWDTLAASLGALARLGVPAIEHRRVAVLDHPLAHMPCARLVDVAQEMRSVLTGWAGADANRTGSVPPNDPENDVPSRLGSPLDGE
ncbi:MAG: hypothetical protein RBS39_02025 [Phycisphaerales bacterium]|jgi:ABC-type Fe3+-hydroxamate transport system substrate-binding protein|nr:hypothetical protein [Phycisphaerales bacterium]